MKIGMNRMSTLWRHLACVRYGRMPIKKAHESSCANLQFVNPGPHPMGCQSERKHETENEEEGGEKKREGDS